MNNQNVILKTHELEVIGHGGMVYEPCQIGEWWVMPAEQYTGTIPPDIQAKWDNFKALKMPVLGYLIADDMREVIQKREQEAEQKRVYEAELERQRRKEAFDRAVQQTAKVGAAVITGVGKVVVGVVAGVAMLTVGIIGALLRFDPILIAVMPDGRWICLGAWYN